MMQGRQILPRAISALGGVGFSRRFAHTFALKKTSGGKIAFPFVQRRRAQSAQILLYHRVNDENDFVFPAVPTRVFTEQMEYVAENYTVCSLDEMVHRLRSNDVPPDLLSITFDDGYRDNFTHAFPVLNRLNLPATIFLATEAVGSGRPLWQDRVFAALRGTSVTTLKQFQGRNVNLAGDKSRALSLILKSLWSLEDGERAQWVEKIIRFLEVQEPTNCEGLMLSWEEVKTMSGNRISFGAHTVTHPVLSKVSAEQAKQEIRASKTIIEHHLSIPVTHFAYPVGRREDFSENTKTYLRDAGFESAVTTIFGANDCKRDLFELRRATPWDHDVDAFALRLNYFKFAS